MTAPQYVSLIERESKRRHLNRQRIGPDATWKAVRNVAFFTFGVAFVILWRSL